MRISDWSSDVCSSDLLMATAKDAARQGDAAAFDAMVWEALRFVPIRPDIFRKAAGAYTIAKGTAHESVIPAGTIVRLLTHSAMFDPYAYEDPDRFNPHRDRKSTRLNSRH